MAKVFHSEIYGLREAKYDWLNKHDIKNVKWNKLEPNKEFYLFIPQDQRMQKSYQTFTKITDIFPVNSVGVVTARDSFVIDSDKKQLEKRIKQFVDSRVDSEILKQTYELRENKSWKIEERRKNLRKDEEWQSAFTQILYRPFDIQWIFYHDEMIERARKEVMQHMLKENVGLLICRQQNKLGFYHSFITDKISEACVISNKTREINYLLPLYIYPETDKKDLFSEHETGEKKPNIKPELFEVLNKNYSTSPSIPLLGKEREEKGEVKVTPEEIFYYIYAVLYSNIYRTKYAEFLKIDFPRVPFTKDYKLFIQLGKLGKQLADLHLLKSDELEKTISKFPIEGNNKVEKPRIDNGKVWINKEQYFDGVKEEVWQYQIGGYQVCDKWLKDRKDRTLNLDEIQTYCKIVTALSKTIELQKETDRYYQKVEKTIITE